MSVFFFFFQPSANWLSSTHIMEINLFHFHFEGLNVSHTWKLPFQHHLDLYMTECLVTTVQPSGPVKSAWHHLCLCKPHSHMHNALPALVLETVAACGDNGFLRRWSWGSARAQGVEGPACMQTLQSALVSAVHIGRKGPVHVLTSDLHIYIIACASLPSYEYICNNNDK